MTYDNLVQLSGKFGVDDGNDLAVGMGALVEVDVDLFARVSAVWESLRFQVESQLLLSLLPLSLLGMSGLFLYTQFLFYSTKMMDYQCKKHFMEVT